MANYQNMMRYGRFGNMYQSRPGCPNYASSASCTDTNSTPACPSVGCRGSREEGRDCGCEHERREGKDRGCECERREGKDRGCERERGEARDCGCERERGEGRDCGCGRERKETRDCGCGRKQEDPLYGMPLAMAYVPWQRWGDIYPVCEGFHTGTIFEELDKPFLGKGGRMR